MRRLLVMCMLVSGLVVGAAVPVVAAPANGHSATEIVLDCGDDGEVTVLVQFLTGSAAVFDLTQGNGRQYVLSALDERVYVDGELVFEFEKTWGQRSGYGRALACAGSAEFEIPGVGIAVAVFDVVLAAK